MIINDYILAPYFTKKNNFSQHDSSYKKGVGGSVADDFNLIKGWYDGVHKLGLHAVIFHNECSKEFVEKYTTDKIKFYFWDIENRPSYNDNRFYGYLKWIDEQKRGSINRILCTDLYDVEILRNPFEFMDASPNCDLFCGEEIITKGSSSWMIKKSVEMEYPTAKNNYSIGNILYNAGIIGGKVNSIRKLFVFMLEDFSNILPQYNANMCVFNKCVERLNYKVCSGSPFHNVFRSNVVDKFTYIKHK